LAGFRPPPPLAAPDLVGTLSTDPGNTARYFNTSAFKAVPINSSGVMLRPGTERYKVEFRAETFNLANHPFFSNPNGDIFAGNFGQINGTQLSSERQMQFALKLKF
jgi:hypothetical protein